MLDSYKRKIDYLRISVTDLCNLRCVYCMPAFGIKKKRHSEILSFEQIAEIVREAIKLGVNKVRLTGGEPLVRRDIEILVAKLAKIKGLKTLAMTTNGILLPKKAKILKKNGLDSINISLDTLSPSEYRRITRGGDVKKAILGIKAAKKAGFTKIKINTVVFKDTTDKELEDLRCFCKKNKLKLQLINHFSLLKKKNESDYKYDRPLPCAKCNRLRLLSTGVLKPCLFSDKEVKINLKNIAQSLKMAIKAKPKEGTKCFSRNMYEIGG